MSFYTFFESPLGRLLLTSDGRSLTGLCFVADAGGPALGPGGVRDERAAPFAAAAAQLSAWFAGRRTRFDLPLAPRGTAFQLRVWRGMSGIRFGQTISYAQLARRIGRPRAARAVGQAAARNPIAIIAPCHRVVGAAGVLTGYAGGLDRKRWLLAHEASLPAGSGGASGAATEGRRSRNARAVRPGSPVRRRTPQRCAPSPRRPARRAAAAER